LYEPFQRCVALERLEHLAKAQTLLSARYEPATRANRPVGLLDLTFERDGSIAVLPLCVLDMEMLVEPKDDLIVWPHAALPWLDEAARAGISAVITPWLQAQTFGRGGHRELIRTFGSEGREIFERARTVGFLGAAPYARVLADSAPALYALRFSGGKTVTVRGPHAAAALQLARHARELAMDLGDPELNEFARMWYGCADIGTSPRQPRADVSIGDCDRAAPVRITCSATEEGFAVPVARPLPLTVMMSFDAQDAPPVAQFRIEVAERAQTRRSRFGSVPDGCGGSSGRILIAIRKDAAEQPDADVDDAFELARRLRSEGFSVDVRSQLAPVDYDAYDLVHAFGALAVDDATWTLRNARAAGKPTVLTPGLEDVGARGVWGARISSALFASHFEERALAQKLLPPLERHEPHPEFEERVRALMDLADVVLVSGAQEEQVLRERFARRDDVYIAAPYLNTGTAPEPVDELVGSEEFVLAHAPIDPRCNQVLLARAVRHLELPLVLLGPVTDATYLELVREQCGDRVYFVPEASPGQVAALYGRARVYADAAWIGYGLRRIAQAAAFGCTLAVSNLRYAGALWRPGLWEVDPANPDSIAAGIGDAWVHAGRSAQTSACAERIAAGCDPIMSLVATATAYARAQQLRLNCAALPAEIKG
jgi:hypothetical protein